MSADLATSVTIQFNVSSPGFRVAAFLRSLRRPRLVFVLLVLFAFPVALAAYACWVGGMPLSTLPLAALAGAGEVALLVAFGCIVAAVRRPLLGAITFSDEGIREHVGSEVVAHDWRWIVDVVEDERRLTLHCEEPLQSFRLGPSARKRVLVLDRSSAEAAIIKKLLAAHV